MIRSAIPGTCSAAFVPPSTNEWYFGGHLVRGPRYIALGRRSSYTAFANALTKRLGAKVYLCDFMRWIDETKPERSLLYFIETSDRIDINLKDIPKEDLRRATVGIGRRVHYRPELRIFYMTAWEINQLFHGGFLDKTHWHLADSMSTEEAFHALGGRVSKERIDDALVVDGEDLGARVASPGDISNYYRRTNSVELARLTEDIASEPQVGRRCTFLESFGSLIVRLNTGLARGALLEITYLKNNLFVLQEYDRHGTVTCWTRNACRDHILRRLGEMRHE